MQFQYLVQMFYEEIPQRISIETNSIYDAITHFMGGVNSGTPCLITDGFTGEVLVDWDGKHSQWCTPEMALMITGWLMEQSWGE